MRALLIKKWGEYYAGQVLTSAEPGSIPADTAVWYGDDEVVPVLPVFNDVIDPNTPALAGRVQAQIAAVAPPPDPEPAVPEPPSD